MITRAQTITFAKRKGVLGLKTSYLTIKKSNICDGKGVFTKKFIKKGTIISQYTGSKRLISSALKRTSIYKKNDKYIYDFDDEKTCIIGSTNMAKLNNKGIAQFCNDTISKTLNNLNNNCNFTEIDGNLYIKAIQNIMPGEELYVSYGINYWISEIINNNSLYDFTYVSWAQKMNSIVKICNDYLEENFAYEILDFDEDTHILSIFLEKNFRKCPYLSDPDKDFHVYTQIIQFKLVLENDKCTMTYNCNICKKCIHKIGEFALNDY